MRTLTTLARAAFALALMAFGVQHLIYGRFVTRVLPNLPAATPWPRVWPYLTGAVLIAAGLAILLNKATRVVAALLGFGLLLSFAFLYIPTLRGTPPLGGLWTNAGKALALAGGAFLIAVFPALIGRVFLAAFLILAGIQHFLFTSFVVGLIPAWIPWRTFWALFAGVALIAGGLGILITRTIKIAALAVGIMIFLWILVIHIPRAWAAPRDSNETTAAFEALAISASVFLVAAYPGSRRPR